MQFYNKITNQTILPFRWQEELKPGDNYVIESPVIGMQLPKLMSSQTMDDVLVYGQILDARNCEPGFFNVITYSVKCPNGDEEIMCIANITRRINRDEFEVARREGWTI